MVVIGRAMLRLHIHSQSEEEHLWTTRRCDDVTQRRSDDYGKCARFMQEAYQLWLVRFQLTVLCIMSCIIINNIMFYYVFTINRKKLNRSNEKRDAEAWRTKRALATEVIEKTTQVKIRQRSNAIFPRGFCKWLLLPLPIYLSHSSSAGCLDSRLILWPFPLQLVKITSQYYIYCAEHYCPTLFGGDAERSTRIANVMANCFQCFTRVSHIFWRAKFCS